jgi:predicted SAM-dependent methyltransferase
MGDDQSALYVQYGCGTCAPETWTNFDVSPTPRLRRIPLLGALLTRGQPHFPKNIRYGDIVKGLPVSPRSCKAIYCSHVLEHLALEDLRIALKNTFELLQPGGTFRFILPDLEILARTYVESSDEQAAMTFMQDACLGYPYRRRRIKQMLAHWLGNSVHLWMWDFKSMSKELTDAGFAQIRRATFNDAADPRFKDVEEARRWDRALAMECIRP